jgi:uncharacterized protein (TIGR03084 family)
LRAELGLCEPSGVSEGVNGDVSNGVAVSQAMSQAGRQAGRQAESPGDRDQERARRLQALVGDLAAEHEALDERLADLPGEAYETPTPAEGWTIADQVSHLTYFDGSAALALRDRAGFEEHRAELFATAGAGDGPDLALGRSLPPAELLGAWRSRRAELRRAVSVAAALATQPRIPWYGPDMSLTSFVTARLMETWAHGQDVADALGLEPVVSPRLRHVIHLGVAARPYAFRVHGVEDPGDPISVHTHNPVDETDVWEFGDPDAADAIRGSALGLAMVFTQRRHPADTDVVAEGATAELFLGVAQAFAGPAGAGRQPAES